MKLSATFTALRGFSLRRGSACGRRRTTITTMKTTIACMGTLAFAASLSFAQEPPVAAPADPGKRPNLEQIFKKLDTNGDGFLSLDEFKASPLGKRDAAKAEDVYKAMDTKADGQVSFEEFKSFRPAWNPERAFRKIDANNDGFLTLDEFKVGPMAQKNPSKAEEIFNKMDTNSDGKVSLEEFTAFHHQWNPAELFKKIDANGDGFLSLDEFKAGPLAQKNPAKAEAIFNKLDVNSDGKVTLEEFRAFRPLRGPRGGNQTATPPPAAR
jgi:Ca2+-binding EF-hand superfamily protein